jgi:hypothetical protein
MDSMNPIDIGTLLALAAFWFSTTKDKAQKSEELGRMKQQIATLETKSVQVDSQLTISTSSSISSWNQMLG